MLKTGGKKSLLPNTHGAGIRDIKCSTKGKLDQPFVIWRNIIRRCYDNNSHPQYNDCNVCNEWLYYSRFKKWFIKQVEDLPEPNMYREYKYQVDKDLFGEGKEYSPQACVLLPKRLNVLIVGGHYGIIKREAKIMFEQSLIPRIVYEKIMERICY
jgi:hypothetical protein